MIAQLGKRGLERRLCVVRVSCHEAQRIDGHRNSAREERRLKQLR
jgi:hypothetical protein